MARNRMIKPDFWDDEKLAKISRDARLVYIAMWNFSDDFGVCKGHPAWLMTRIFPYDVELTPVEFESWLKELAEFDRIKPFCKNKELFFYLPKFLSHQKINRPSSVSRNPEPPDEIVQDNGCLNDGSMSPQGLFNEGSCPKRREKKISIKENKRNKENSGKNWPEDFELNDKLKEYAVENGIDPRKTEAFFEDFHQWALSKGAKYKDWEAAFRTRVMKAPAYGQYFLIEKQCGKGVNLDEPRSD